MILPYHRLSIQYFFSYHKLHLQSPTMTVPDWQRKAQVALDHRDETLSHVSPKLGKLPNPLPLSSQGLPKLLLTEREFELTENYDAIALVDMMKSKKVSSEEVTRAFLRRAAIAQESVRSPPLFAVACYQCPKWKIFELTISIG